MEKEEWLIHPKVPDLESQIIIQLWPFIESNHQIHPQDIIWVDANRIHLMFDKGKLDPKLCNFQHPKWSNQNPIPVNSIFDDHQVIEIWERKIPGSEKLIHTQQLEDIKTMLTEKNKYKNVILVAYQGPRFHPKNNKIQLQTVVCYKITLLEKNKITLES